MTEREPYVKRETRKGIASAIVLALRLDKETGKKHIVTFDEETGYNARTNDDL